MTGGAGFVGSHLVDRLVAEGWRVLVVDALRTGSVGNVSAEATLEVLDIVVADLDALLLRWRPWIVFHLAAQASVPESIRDPLNDLAVNVVGTHRLASAARSAGASRLVFVSSGGAVYGETRRPATEAARPAPTSYYGIHKLTAEGHVAIAGIPYAIARPSNLYGPRQTPGLEGAVVAAFLEQAMTTRTLRIHGDGTQTRDFVHVTDAVDALWRLGIAAAERGIWNIASGRTTSILELAGLIEQAVGKDVMRTFGPRRPGDVSDSSMSAGLLRRSGWRPRTSLSAGVAELAAISGATASPAVGG